MFLRFIRWGVMKELRREHDRGVVLNVWFRLGLPRLMFNLWSFRGLLQLLMKAKIPNFQSHS